jgi:hypothetical protein
VFSGLSRGASRSSIRSYPVGAVGATVLTVPPH